MGKAPAFQWYPGDWFREPGLKVVDLSVRGAWAELLMHMWDCNPQGQFEASIFGYSNLWRTTIETAAFIIQELRINNIANIEFDSPETVEFINAVHLMSVDLAEDVPEMSQAKTMYVTITNRRMYNQWKDKEYERLKKQRQREGKSIKREKSKLSPECPLNVPLYSSSSSSSSTSKNKDMAEKTARSSPKKSPKKFVPPTEQEVVKYSEDNGYPSELGQRVFKYYSSANWKDSRGKQVKNWKQKMQGVWFRPENLPKQDFRPSPKIVTAPEGFAADG